MSYVVTTGGWRQHRHGMRYHAYVASWESLMSSQCTDEAQNGIDERARHHSVPDRPLPPSARLQNMFHPFIHSLARPVQDMTLSLWKKYIATKSVGASTVLVHGDFKTAMALASACEMEILHHLRTYVLRHLGPPFSLLYHVLEHLSAALFIHSYGSALSVRTSKLHSFRWCFESKRQEETSSLHHLTSPTSTQLTKPRPVS